MSVQHNSGTLTATAGGTEDFVGTDPETSDGAFSFIVDLSNMVRGDAVRIRVYEVALSADATSLLVMDVPFFNTQVKTLFMSCTYNLLHRWRFSITQEAGTARNFKWSIRRENLLQTAVVDAIGEEPAGDHVAAGTWGAQWKTLLDAINTSTSSMETSGVQLSAQGKLDVNAEVVDVVNVDTFAEPGQEAPAATNTLVAKIGYLFKAWRNRATQTATQYSLYNDDAATIDQKATVSDAAGTADKGEVGTGP